MLSSSGLTLSIKLSSVCITFPNLSVAPLISILGFPHECGITNEYLYSSVYVLLPSQVIWSSIALVLFPSESVVIIAILGVSFLTTSLNLTVNVTDSPVLYS